MKKNSVMVKQVLMSILTAGMIGFGFASCSSDSIESDATNATPETVTGENVQLQAPLGLVYSDFISSDDVQILNGDTTMIAVSKAYADKMGVNNFVNHPMGIWQKIDERAFLRRATAQKLVGDKYILNVVNAELCEVLAGQPMEFNTGIYVNPNAGTTRGTAGMASKYTDSRGVAHPAAVTLTRLPGESVTRGGAFSAHGTLSAEQIMAGETFTSGTTRGFISDAAECFIRFIKSGGHFTGDKTGRIMQIDGTIEPPKIHIKTGENKGDTVTIKSKIPYNVELNYTLKVDAWVKPQLSFNPLDLLKVQTNYFEGRLDGKFSMAPQMTLGISGKAELPKDKQDHKLCDLTEVHFTFFAGVVPIDICLQPNLSAHINTGVAGSVYTGIKYEYASEFSAGIKYQNGKWQPIANHEVKKNDFSFITPRGTFHAEAEMGIMLGCDVLVNLLTGPTASFGPMLKGELDAKLAPMEKTPFTFDAGITLGLMGKAGAKVKLWKIELFDWEFDLKFGPQWDIWSFSYPNDDNSGKGGNDKLTKQIEEMKQLVQEDIEVSKARSEMMWKTFKSAMSMDDQVRAAYNNLKEFDEKDYRGVTQHYTPESLYEAAISSVYHSTIKKYQKIDRQYFAEMKAQLLSTLNRMAR